MSKKLGGGGGCRAAAIWMQGVDVFFCVGFDDGRFEIVEVGRKDGLLCDAPAASSCAVKSVVHHASPASSSSSQLFVAHTNGMVHMYVVSCVEGGGACSQLQASIRFRLCGLGELRGFYVIDVPQLIESSRTFNFRFFVLTRFVRLHSAGVNAMDVYSG